MSIQETKRKNAIEKEFDSAPREAQTAVSKLVTETARIRLLIIFLHHSLLSNTGEVSEGDRLDVRDSLVPLYPQIQDALADITALFNIHDDNNATWQANLDAYLLANPTVLSEALSRYPAVI